MDIVKLINIMQIAIWDYQIKRYSPVSFLALTSQKETDFAVTDNFDRLLL